MSQVDSVEGCDAHIRMHVYTPRCDEVYIGLATHHTYNDYEVLRIREFSSSSSSPSRGSATHVLPPARATTPATAAGGGGEVVAPAAASIYSKVRRGLLDRVRVQRSSPHSYSSVLTDKYGFLGSTSRASAMLDTIFAVSGTGGRGTGGSAGAAATRRLGSGEVPAPAPAPGLGRALPLPLRTLYAPCASALSGGLRAFVAMDTLNSMSKVAPAQVTEELLVQVRILGLPVLLLSYPALLLLLLLLLRLVCYYLFLLSPSLSPPLSPSLS